MLIDYGEFGISPFLVKSFGILMVIPIILRTVLWISMQILKKFLFSVLFLSSAAIASEKFKMKGSVSTGFAVKRFKTGESGYDARLKLTTKRKNGFKAVVRVKGLSDEPFLLMQDAYIDKKLSDSSLVKFGFTKKIVGFEYYVSRSERRLIKRSIIYKKLAAFGFVGRENQLKYATLSDDGRNLYSIGISYAESQDASLVLSGMWGFGDLELANWLMVQIDKTEAGNQFVFLNTSSLVKELFENKLFIELMVGKDPERSSFEKIFRDGEPVYFGGITGQYGIKIDDLYEPFIGGSYVVHDNRNQGFKTSSVTVGLNYFIDELRLAANVVMVENSNPVDNSNEEIEEGGFIFEARYFF